MLEVVRVDDRLIHGQVVSGWIRSNSIEVIVIVDNKIANDKIQQSILKLATPPGIKLYSLTEEKFLSVYNKGILENYRTMLIFADILAVKRLVENNFKIKNLNIGGIRMKPGRTNYTKAVSLNEEEKSAVIEFNEKGINLDLRLVPSDSNIDIIKLFK